MGWPSYIVMREYDHNDKLVVYAVLYNHWSAPIIAFQLYSILRHMIVSNISTHPICKKLKRNANGAGCLFAQIIADFKIGPRGAYLCPPIDDDDCDTFKVTVNKDSSITLKVNDFNGDPTTKEAKEHFSKLAKDLKEETAIYDDFSDSGQQLVESFIIEDNT